MTTSSYALEGNILHRLQSMWETYGSLRIETIGGKIVKALEIHKSNHVGLSSGNLVNFQIYKQVGIRIMPLGRTKT